MTPSITLSNQNSNHSKYLPWIVWGLGCLFYFYEFLLQVSPGVMVEELMRTFKISAHGLGILSGMYFWSYAGMQIPVGIILDRLGPHRLLTGAVLVCAVSSIIFGTAQYFGVAIFARFLIGLGSSFAVVGTMKLASIWFPNDHFARLTGFLVTIGMLGAMGGASPLALLVHHVGFRISMILLGACGLLLAGALFIYLKKTKQGPLEHNLPKIASKSLWQGLKSVLRNKQSWIVACYGGLMYMPTPTFCGLWGVPFLMQKFDITRPKAAFLTSLIFLGWAIGSPLWGIYSDKIQKRLPPMKIGTVGSLLFLLLILYFPWINLFTMGCFLFLLGICSSGFLTAFSILRESHADDMCATALGFMNMMNMVGIAFAQPLIGKLLDLFWDGTWAAGVRIYSLADYEGSLSVLAIGVVIALLLLPFIKETHCRHSS